MYALRVFCYPRCLIIFFFFSKPDAEPVLKKRKRPRVIWSQRSRNRGIKIIALGNNTGSEQALIIIV